jgi:hypothetical protein
MKHPVFEHPRLKIINTYFQEHDKLAFCIEVLERGLKNLEKRKYYESFADEQNKKLAEMEEKNPFLVEVLQIIDRD